MEADWENRYKVLMQELRSLLEKWDKVQFNDSYYWTERNAGREDGIESCADDLRYLMKEII